jgi:hypothetical protein
MNSKARLFKWISGGFEIALGIPILGGTIIISTLYIPLVIALGLHITALVFSKQEDRPITGNVVGIVTSLIAWIPILGMIMHIITGILVLLEAGQNKVAAK